MTKTFISPPKMVLPPFYTVLRLFDRFCVIPKKNQKKCGVLIVPWGGTLKKKKKKKKKEVLGKI